MYKMIALDLDGTLNNDEKKITPKMMSSPLPTLNSTEAMPMGTS